MNTILKSCLQPAFVLCVVTLGLAAGFKETAIKRWGYHLVKQPIPLRQPLDDIDAARLAPYRVVRQAKIENADVLESLGTENYIQWELEDSEAEASSAVRYCSLFITYYTGDPDRVPHVPEECVTGAGDTMMTSDGERLRVAVGETPMGGLEVKGGEVRLPVRYLTFLRNPKSVWETEMRYAVLYFFKANGQFANSRAGTRWIMGENLFGKYSYFSKVEWKFYGLAPGGLVHGSKDKVLAASEKLMSRLLPLLETEHWPDWEAANEAE